VAVRKHSMRRLTIESSVCKKHVWVKKDHHSCRQIAIFLHVLRPLPCKAVCCAGMLVLKKIVSLKNARKMAHDHTVT
jgi:hypothetical protein